MSSSHPKIVIAPKKKKTKVISSLKRPPTTTDSGSNQPSSLASSTAIAGGVAVGGAIAPPSPTTVLPPESQESHTTYNDKVSTITTKTMKRPTGSVLIKAYAKPPALPADFYDTSLTALRDALSTVLIRNFEAKCGGSIQPSPQQQQQQQSKSLLQDDVCMEDATTTTITTLQQKARPHYSKLGREELYRSVEDLRVHGHGTRLYLDVAALMDHAAIETVRRLCAHCGGNDDNVEINAIIDSNTGHVGYDITQISCITTNNNVFDHQSAGGVGSSSTLDGGDDDVRRTNILRRMRNVLRSSYVEGYLTFVRSIFLALDGAYVYQSDISLEDITGCILSSSSSSSWGGRVLDRSLVGVTSGGMLGGGGSAYTDTRIWSLRDVGIACLRWHATMSLPSPPPVVDSGGEEGRTIPVLTTLILATTHTILSEYDQQRDGGDGKVSSSSSTPSTVFDDVRPLTRDCVRSIIDLGSLPSLLEEIIIVASSRFGREGMSWKEALSEGRRSASDFLLHVEHRLKRGVGLADYYFPGNANGVNVALRGLSRLDCLKGANVMPQQQSSSGTIVTSSGDDVVIWSPADDCARRIFPAIVERRLLGPNLCIPGSGVLEIGHLFPMLDDDTMGSGGDIAWKSHGTGSKTYEDAKRLYGLCWRMTASASSTSSGGDSTMLTAMNLLRVAFGKYGRIRGHEIVQQGLPKLSLDGTPIANNNMNLKDMEKMVVPDLLAFRKHLYNLHSTAFRGEESFGGTVRSILDDVLNGSASGSSLLDDGDAEGGRRTAELLAKHVDIRFKDAKASAGLSSGSGAAASSVPGGLIDAAIAADANESFQNEIFVLFRHLHSKDVFEAFYKRELAKRLLTGRAVSTDMEWSFLTKLKSECGTSYTSKMEGMFQDIELSRDIMANFTAYSSGLAASASPARAVSKAVNMDVQLLTTGFWPNYPQYSNIILPPEMLALRTKFETYYNSKYQGRRIAWQYSLGNCIVKASFPKSAGPKELIVNVCQSLVLLCFSDGDDGRGLTLDEVMKKTGIDDRPELERTLQSLSMGREGTRVLRKVDYDSLAQPVSPHGQSPRDDNTDTNSSQKTKRQRVRRNVGPYDRFLFNASFTSNQRRIRITNITMKETSEERTKTHAAVSKDRLYFIDAACVRIMKARKIIDHRDLIGEIMSQLKFPASSADIKNRIESLIEREYMERVENDRSKYKYLA